MFGTPGPKAARPHLLGARAAAVCLPILGECGEGRIGSVAAAGLGFWGFRTQNPNPNPRTF